MSRTSHRISVVMVGPDLNVRGGISEVARTLLSSKPLERVDCTYLSTHVDGNRLAKFTKGVRAYGSLIRMLALDRPDVVHIHTASRFSFYRKLPVFSLAKLWRVRTVVHVHGAEFELFHDQHRLHATLIRWMLGHADVVIALSNGWRDTLSKMSPNANVRRMYNPVPFDEHRLSLEGEKPGRSELLFMGRLGVRKGIYDLLHAFKNVVTSIPEAHLTIAGDGELTKVQIVCRELSIEGNVSVLGWIRGARKTECLNEACVYVLPSYNEGQPMSILEAMATGLPIISTPVGGTPEAVVDGVNGYLVQPGDVGALADRISYLLAHPEVRHSMGIRNREKVRELFSVDKIAADLVAIYESVVPS